MYMLEPGKWPITTKCVGDRSQGCGAKLLVERRDVFRVLAPFWTCVFRFWRAVDVAFKCPACSVITRLPELAPLVKEVQSYRDRKFDEDMRKIQDARRLPFLE